MRPWMSLNVVVRHMATWCACLLIQGCRMCDVSIIDPETGEIHGLPCNGFRQRIIAVNEGASEFTTLVTKGRNAGLHTFDFGGRLKRQTPCLEMLRNHRRSDGLGATEDARKIAYRKHETGHLYLIDTLAMKESLVCLDIASGPQWDSIKGLEWVTGTKVVLLLNADEGVRRERAAIDILDVITKERKTVHCPKYIAEYALSPDKRHIAFIDGRWEDSIVRIIDIETGAVLCSTEPDKYSDVRWCDNTAIGYVSRCRNVMLLPLAEKKAHTIFTMPDGFACYNFAIGKGYFAVNSHLTPTPLRPPAVTPMLICDLKTGKTTRTLHACFFGSWLVADRGRKIICETGY